MRIYTSDHGKSVSANGSMSTTQQTENVSGTQYILNQSKSMLSKLGVSEDKVDKLGQALELASMVCAQIRIAKTMVDAFGGTLQAVLGDKKTDSDIPYPEDKLANLSGRKDCAQKLLDAHKEVLPNSNFAFKTLEGAIKMEPDEFRKEISKNFLSNQYLTFLNNETRNDNDVKRDLDKEDTLENENIPKPA